MAALSTRGLALTVTEKGCDPELDSLIAQGLPVLTMASHDNLAGDGRQLQVLRVAAARQHSPLDLAGAASGRAAVRTGTAIDQRGSAMEF